MSSRPPTDRDMLPPERREFVRTHRTCAFGTTRPTEGPAISVVYYVPNDTDELLVSTMRTRGKARVIARDPKVGICVFDERWPFAHVQVYCDAVVDDDSGGGRESVVRPRTSSRSSEMPVAHSEATRRVR